MYSTPRRYLSFWLKCDWLISACPSECMPTLSSSFPLQAEGPITESCWSHLLIYLESVFLYVCIVLRWFRLSSFITRISAKLVSLLLALRPFNPFSAVRGIWFKYRMGNSYQVLPATGAAFLPFLFTAFHLVLPAASTPYSPGLSTSLKMLCSLEVSVTPNPEILSCVFSLNGILHIIPVHPWGFILGGSRLPIELFLTFHVWSRHPPICSQTAHFPC